jgi:hypothetical protein
MIRFIIWQFRFSFLYNSVKPSFIILVNLICLCSPQFFFLLRPSWVLIIQISYLECPLLHSIQSLISKLLLILLILHLILEVLSYRFLVFLIIKVVNVRNKDPWIFSVIVIVSVIFCLTSFTWLILTYYLLKDLFIWSIFKV